MAAQRSASYYTLLPPDVYKRQPIPLADLLGVDLDSLLSPLLRQDGGSFLTRLAEGSLAFPLGVGRDTPAYRELAASFRACVGLVREKRCV